MRLLYCYIRFLDEEGNEVYYHGQKCVEINLSTKYRFAFYPEKNMFVRENRNAPLPDHFWANENAEPEHCNIYNINVIAGQNGSGKTTAIRCIMNMLDFFHAAANDDEEKKYSLSDVKRNQYLLLFEDNDHDYLLSYMPMQETKTKPIQTEGFSGNEPLLYSSTDWSQLFKEKTEASEDIQSFLLKTKVIHITNALSQYDYERSIEKQNEGLRDYFIFDVSIGATIGPQVGQFFPYEVYKQVKYVFDKNQSDIRERIEKQTKKRIMGFKVPDSLRLILRTQQYQDYITEPYTYTRTNATSSYLVELLGVFCVGAFAENLKMRLKQKKLPPISKQSIKELGNNAHAQSVLQQMILDTEKIYYDIEQCKSYERSGAISWLLPLKDGRIVSASEGDGCVIWNLETGHNQTMKECGKVVCATYYKESSILFASNDGTIWLWNTDDKGTMPKELCVLQDGITCIATSRDGEKVICGTETGEIYIIDSTSGRQIDKLQVYPKGVFTSIVVTQDDWLFCCCDDGYVYALIGRERYAYKHEEYGTATCMALLPDDRIIIGTQDGYLCVWDPKSLEKTLYAWKEKHNNSITCISISLDRKRIISGSSDGNIYIWDTKTETCVYKIKTGDKGITSAVILSNGWVATCSGGTDFMIWNVPDGMRLQKRQKQLLEEIDKKSNNISKSTIIYEKEIEKIIPGMGFPHILAENCLHYIKFIYDKKESFFKQIKGINNNVFEISLSTSMTDEFAQDMIQFMQKYRYTCEPAYTIDFDWGLSSGEENMLRIFSDLYHVFDRDYSSGKYGDYKIYNNENSSHNQREKTECDTVLLFMDEADLTLHPEWQRCLVETLTTYIPWVYPKSCAKDIQLIITTHSPLLLGDIPSENITYLHCQQDNEQGNTPGETFGQNIHTILRDSFFLSEGTVGAFAAKKINNAAERLVEIKKEASADNADIPSLQNEMKGIQEIVNLVAPGVLRIKLEDLYQEAMDALDNKNKQQHEKAEEWLQTLWKLTPEDQQYVINAIYQEKTEND